MARLANRAGLGKLSGQLGACSTTLGYGADGTLVARYACRKKECSIDQASRSAVWANRLHEAMPALVADHPTWRFILMTLTAGESVPILHLNDERQRLTKAIDTMAKRKAFAPVGYVRNTEETLANGYAHPHSHLLCAVPSEYFDAPVRKVKGPKGRPQIVAGYMHQRQWQLLWGECLGLDVPLSYLEFTDEHKALSTDEWRAMWPNNDAPVMDVRAIKGDITSPKARKALYEVTKYGTKPGDLMMLEPDDFRHLHFQNKGARAIGICGALSKYLKAMPDEENPRVFPGVAIAAVWNEEHKRYFTNFGLLPTDELQHEQDKRAMLNLAQLPHMKELVRQALKKNSLGAQDYATAARIRDGTLSNERMHYERGVVNEHRRLARMDGKDDRREERLLAVLIATANAKMAGKDPYVHERARTLHEIPPAELAALRASIVRCEEQRTAVTWAIVDGALRRSS